MIKSNANPKIKTTKKALPIINNLPPKLKFQIFLPSFFISLLKFGFIYIAKFQRKTKPTEPRNNKITKNKGKTRKTNTTRKRQKERKEQE